MLCKIRDFFGANLKPIYHHIFSFIALPAAFLMLALILTSCQGNSGTNSEEEIDPGIIQSFEDLDDQLNEMVEENGVIGMSFAALDNGQVEWVKSYGYANLETGEGAFSETPFLVASISKTVTGVAVMQLVEEGAITLDDDINNYLPFDVVNPHSDEKITVRHLMTHSSGIIDYHYDPYLDSNYTFYDRDPDISLEQMMYDFLNPEGAYYSSESFDTGNPGSYYEYSNLAVALLGLIVEHTADSFFSAYTYDHIFQPMGMQNTAWYLQNLSTTLAMPYDADSLAFGHYTFADFPNGGLRTSVNDYAKFMAAIASGGNMDGVQLLKSATTNEMLTVQEGEIYQADGQGLIFYQQSRGDIKYWSHSGSEKGVATNMLFDAETGDGFVYFVNMDVGNNFFTDMEQISVELFEFLR